jgi:hypothetical protein
LPDNHIGELAFTYVVSDGQLRDAASVTLHARPYWHNERSPLDVNDDGLITAMDALAVVNHLNLKDEPLPAPSSGQQPPHFVDTNGDGFVTPHDVLLVVNHLNYGGGSQAEAEGEWSAGVDAAFGDGDMLDLLADDTASAFT